MQALLLRYIINNARKQIIFILIAITQKHDSKEVILFGIFQSALKILKINNTTFILQDCCFENIRVPRFPKKFSNIWGER